MIGRFEGLVRCPGKDGTGCAAEPGSLVEPGRICSSCSKPNLYPRRRDLKPEAHAKKETR